MGSSAATVESLLIPQSYVLNADEWLMQQKKWEPGWLNELRQEALHSFTQHGFPSRKSESWKYTHLESITRQQYQLAQRGTAFIEANRLTPPVMSQHRIVLVNGYVDTRLSQLGRISSGLSILSLRQALRRKPELLTELFQQQLHSIRDGMQALNIAFMSDGVVIHLERGMEFDQPLHIIHINDTQQPTASHYFHVIQLAEHSRAQIIESFLGLGDTDYFTNNQCIIQLGNNAELEHHILQTEQQQAAHLAKREIKQAENSQLSLYSAALGSHLSRDELRVRLQGAGAECHLNGLFLANDMQHHDFNLNITHQAENCVSRELYRGIADRRGSGVFDGKIIVAPQAQKTDAVMNTKNLVLSPQAEIDIKPQLEIYADDVKCAHGATVGQIDENMLFYLQSRGLDEKVSRSLLTFAFINEVVDPIENELIKNTIQQAMFEHLPSSDSIRGLIWR